MRVLFLINYAGAGGTEKYVKIMARALEDRGDEVFFCYNVAGPLAVEIGANCQKSMRLEMEGPTDLRAAKSLARFCKENDVEIIHTQFARENYIALLSEFFGSNVVVIHTSHINLENNILRRLANKFLMRRNKAVIAVCGSVKEQLIKNNYPAEKIHVIHNGIKFEPLTEKNNAVREEFNITGFLFVTLTRFSPEKGIFFLLESAVKLKEICQVPHSILIAGEGELLEEAKVFAKEKGLDNVIFPGYRTDAQLILESGDCFINSSQSEASSFALFEAMGKGLPLIAAKVGGNPDIVTPEVGILVEYGNGSEMALAMKKMAEEPDFRRKLGENALHAAKSRFNIDNTIEKTYALYEEILEERGKR